MYDAIEQQKSFHLKVESMSYKVMFKQIKNINNKRLFEIIKNIISF
jgi:hypothetical protein